MSSSVMVVLPEVPRLLWLIPRSKLKSVLWMLLRGPEMCLYRDIGKWAWKKPNSHCCSLGFLAMYVQFMSSPGMTCSVIVLDLFGAIVTYRLPTLHAPLDQEVILLYWYRLCALKPFFGSTGNIIKYHCGILKFSKEESVLYSVWNKM